MYYRRVFPLLLLALPLSPVFAAPQADPARFEKAVQAFEAEDAAKTPPEGLTLFVGASNIRRWDSLSRRFKKSPVLNRGFGGSQMSDMVHFADRIVIKYRPKQIYLNTGGNDLHSGRTPEEVLAAFQDFAAKVREELPKTKLSYLSIPPSPKRWDEVELVKKANRLIADFAAAHDGLEFIDTFSLLLGADGKPRPECFVEDRLHLSETGYDVVTSAIRWQNDIRAFEKLDAKNPPPASPIIFTGSSSIRMWKTLAEDFPGLPVINRGFGGSEVFDAVTYADQLVIRHRPRQVVMYSGSNDINGGKTPGRVLADFHAFTAKVLAALPECRISYIANAPNPSRWALVDKMREANALVEEFTKTDPRLEFINTHDAMLGADGKPLPDIFLKDNLHMNSKGYAIWTKIVGPHLK
ncbi:MAG: GDSL-type esterase/lipase family protein [Prosthecobacter sp.]